MTAYRAGGTVAGRYSMICKCGKRLVSEDPSPWAISEDADAMFCCYRCRTIKLTMRRDNR